MNDIEIEGLYKASSYACTPDMTTLDIRKFCELIARTAKEKPVPSFVTTSMKPGSKVSKGGVGAKGESTSAFEHWEMEKKYKRNLEALKQEIEERNREIQNAKTEARDANIRSRKLETEKESLEMRLVNNKSKTAKDMRIDSMKTGEID